jgi:hypothetical protein
MFTPQSSELGGDLTDKTRKKQPNRAKGSAAGLLMKPAE